MRLFSQLRRKGEKRNNRSRDVRRTCRLEQLEERKMFYMFEGSFDWIEIPDSELEHEDGYADFDRSVLDARPEATGDFNGDGYNDLAIGRPNAGDYKGEVTIQYGSQAGLTEQVLWTQDDITGIDGESEGRVYKKFGPRYEWLVPAEKWTLGFADPGYKIVQYPGEGDSFGRSLATGDFNGDGYDDLALREP